MPESPQSRFADAAERHRAGDYRVALEAYLPLVNDPEIGADVASNLSALSLQLGDTGGAVRYGELAVGRQPDHANGWNHLALALRTNGDMNGAFKAFQRTVRLDPKHAQAFANLAEMHVARDDIPAAIACYESALAIEPELSTALTGYVHRKQQIADWDGLDAALARLSRQIWRGEPAIDPFMLLFCCNDPREILKCCQNQAATREWTAIERHGRTDFPHDPGRPGRIKIGYVSANFYDHAVGTLICQLLESHDRAQFEVTCYCHSSMKQGARRERIKRACDHFIEIGDLGDFDAAKRIHEDGISILVDLMGYTKGQRLGIFALRPAPVQVTWMGFAGSSGGNAADYIIADRVVIPPGSESFYDEKPVRMPVCYQVNDSTRDLSQAPMTRGQFGIPEDAVLFCNFNQIAKITPPIVDLWAEILKNVPDSVLWLWGIYEAGSRNMRKAMADLGVSPERIHFGATLPEAEHLTRYSLCDLFLDSYPYCGHATSSNALFGSVPVLALPGKTFASRVSASLLTALDLPELIASSPEDYVKKAIALGHDRERLSDLKRKLVTARATSPLFDGARFARDIESAYRIMMERFQNGEPPAAIDL